MERSEVKALVEANLGRLMRLTGTAHWSVTVAYEPLSGRDDDDDGGPFATKARVYVSPDYERAHVVIDPGEADDPQDVIETLLHELFHVVLAPFETFERAAEGAVKRRTWDKILAGVRTHAIERMVLNVTRLFRQMDDEARALAAAAEERGRREALAKSRAKPEDKSGTNRGQAGDTRKSKPPARAGKGRV